MKRAKIVFYIEEIESHKEICEKSQIIMEFNEHELLHVDDIIKASFIGIERFTKNKIIDWLEYEDKPSL